MANPRKSPVRSTARLEWNNRSQTVTLPLEYRFDDSVREVQIRREGQSIILTPRPEDWATFFASELKASDGFMAERGALSVQERKF